MIGVVLMTTAITAIGGMFCGFLSNHIDISPNFAGTLMGITNTVATIPGIAVPFVVNELTTHDVSLFVNLLDSFLVKVLMIKSYQVVQLFKFLFYSN